MDNILTLLIVALLFGGTGFAIKKLMGIPFTPVVPMCRKYWNCRVPDQRQQPAGRGGERAIHGHLSGGG